MIYPTAHQHCHDCEWRLMAPNIKKNDVKMKKCSKVEYQKMNNFLKRRKTTQMNIVKKQPKPENGQQNFMKQKQTTTSNGVTHEEGKMTPHSAIRE